MSNEMERVYKVLDRIDAQQLANNLAIKNLAAQQ
jgi:hypothetical protein